MRYLWWRLSSSDDIPLVEFILIRWYTSGRVYPHQMMYLWCSLSSLDDVPLVQFTLIGWCAFGGVYVPCIYSHVRWSFCRWFRSVVVSHLCWTLLISFVCQCCRVYLVQSQECCLCMVYAFETILPTERRVLFVSKLGRWHAWCMCAFWTQIY